MARYRFLDAFKAARGALFGRLLEAGQELGDLQTAARATTDVWFTPQLVKDYDESEFADLQPEERRELSQAVGEFRQLAGQSASTPEEIDRAAGLFARINGVLHPHIDEPDVRRIAEATRGIPWPAFVRWADFRLATDSTGDPAVWVTLTLTDDAAIESADFRTRMRTLRDAYRTAIQKAGIDRWPYFSLRTLSDVRDLL
ncbi:MAG: hypothetical protein K2V38_20460, partial [Gemmataceae bacterium]|nr:hypothetical protein [Gemmataceae bacterium]